MSRAVAGLTLACFTCGKQALIILSQFSIPAYCSGGRFRPDVPLPEGWSAFAAGAESAFQCGGCSARHQDLLSEARAAKGAPHGQ